MSPNPARILNLPKGTLKHGADADITVIDPQLKWTVDVKAFCSRGKNSPFHGREMQGKAILTIVGGEIKYRLSARESHKTTGFVLRTLSYGESDLIVTFYSHDFGKFKGIAKGAKRSKKRFANVFEPFSLTNIIFSRKNRDMLAFIESCDIIDHYDAIRQDLEKTLIASYFIDLTDHFSPEGKKNERLFELLQDFFMMLGRKKLVIAAVRFFEMRLLKLTGFEPTLDHCIICKTPVTNGNAYYFYATGRRN